MNFVSRPAVAPLLTLAALALLSGCSTNFFGGRRANLDQGPVVEGHPLILPPDYAQRPPRQADNYEAALPKDHFGARRVEGQRTVQDATRVTLATVVAVSESTLATAPSLPGTVPSPLSTSHVGLDPDVAGALNAAPTKQATTQVKEQAAAKPATSSGATTQTPAQAVVAEPVSGTDDMQAAIARDTAQEKADNNGFFHRYFGWMIPGHGKK